jgi:hypothetical protein
MKDIKYKDIVPGKKLILTLITIYFPSLAAIPMSNMSL